MFNAVMPLEENDAPEQLELSSDSLNDAATLEAKGEQLLACNQFEPTGYDGGAGAWLLNNFPKTRDSDITLQIRY